MSSLDAIISKLVHLRYSQHVVSPMLSTDTVTDSHQSLDISFFLQIDSDSFANYRVGTLPPPLKKDGTNPFD